MKFILFCQNAYAFEIMAPIRNVLLAQNDEFIWYTSKNLLLEFPFKKERHTTSILDVQLYKSDVIFVAGNDVPYYLRGLKIKIFHSLASEKKDHFRIHHYFDVYFTQGPYFTERFNQFKKKYKDFDVIETGWPKLDVYSTDKNNYQKEKQELLKKYHSDKIIVYAPTFSPSLTSAAELLPEIEKIAVETKYVVLVKFHDLMDSKWVEAYQNLAKKHKNILFQTKKNITKFLIIADLLISDTSSVIYEFSLLDKPVISFKSISKHIYWNNITQPSQLKEQLIKNLTEDSCQNQRSQQNALYHPYTDGKSSLRMIAAAKDYIAKNGVPEQRVLSRYRKSKIDSTFGKPINNRWNGVVKNKISATLITYNEIIHIAEVLENVSFANEIIIIDSYSTDGTFEYIKTHENVKLIQRPFKNYTDQKSFAVSQASNNWILFMDADERLTDKLKNEILKTVNADQQAVAYYFYRTFMFKKQVLRYSGWQSDKNFRLFQKNKAYFTQERIVHETLVVNGKIDVLKNKLIHYSYKDYEDYKGKMIKYGQMKAKEELSKNYAPNLYHFYLRPVYKFINHFILRLGFLDGKNGLIISYLNALGVYARYQELKRLKSNRKKHIDSPYTPTTELAIVPKHFLVIQQKMIGDVLASTVICESLKYHFPKAVVHIVANENTLAVLEKNPFIDEVIIFKKEYRQSKKKFYTFLKSLKKTKYDAALDAYGKLESNLISLFSEASQKIANNKWYTSWVYTKTIHQKKRGDGQIPLSVSNRLMLLDPLVKENSELFYPKIYLSQDEKDIAQKAIKDRLGNQNGLLLMVNILGSAKYKTYPPKYMATLLDAICEKEKITLLFNYIPSQKEEALAIYNLCSPNTQKSIAFDFYAPSLREFIALLSQCDVLFGNEGGAVNMAKALNIPSFCIFSPFINKNAWYGNVYKKDKGVHLADFYPELFEGKSKKELKENSEFLYKKYKPELFQKALLDFLENVKC